VVRKTFLKFLAVSWAWWKESEILLLRSANFEWSKLDWVGVTWALLFLYRIRIFKKQSLIEGKKCV
jgi:hypothetical protein